MVQELVEVSGSGELVEVQSSSLGCSSYPVAAHYEKDAVVIDAGSGCATSANLAEKSSSVAGVVEVGVESKEMDQVVAS